MKQIFTILILIILNGANVFALVETRHREYPFSKEKRLRIELEVAVGELYIKSGPSEKIAVIDYEESAELSQKLSMTYSLDGTTGVLRIKLKDEMKLFKNDSKKKKDYRRLTLNIAESIPVEMKIEIGAGECNIDLSKLYVKSLELSAGASNVELYTSTPNKIFAENITIECGVGKFVGKHLANLNFRTLDFQGGVGSYSLEFDGTLRQSGDVSVEVGVGSVSLLFPPSIPVKIYCEDHWLSSAHVDGNFDKPSSGIFLTRNLNYSEPFITVRVQSGIGSVQIRQK
jgi:hypothetical protein